MRSILGALQPLGRALMLPIAVLPVAGLLLRLGQPDLLDIGFVSAAGDAIFGHLGLLFAIGVATGFARDGNGAACLAGMVCFLVTTEAAKALLAVPADAAPGLAGAGADLAVAAWKAKAIARLDVPIGIVSGIVGGLFYNRFSGVKLPDYLAFFGGRRFVPIVSGVAGLILAVPIGLGFGAIAGAIDALGAALAASGNGGLFLFGLANRLLLVTGLHHLVNNVPWFVLGDYHGVNGDLRRFFAGDPTAGGFMAGFFPVMMFGLPAACLAMYRAADPDRRKAVGGMLLSLALTSMLTGVTEPIEFSFMFLAPLLYLLHAVLTGVSMALMNMLGVKLGFGFSAGLLDYVLNYGKATRPLLLFPVGIAWFLLYYGLFAYCIRRFDLPTPGREPLPADAASIVDDGAEPHGRGEAFARALGGARNLETVTACTTRLRLVVRDQRRVDEPALRALGARGLIRPSDTTLQVVVGPIADMVAVEIREALASDAEVRAAPTPMPDKAPMAIAPAPALADALGRAANIRALTRHEGRLRVALIDENAIDHAASVIAGVAITCPVPGILHLLADETVLDALVETAEPPGKRV